MKITCNSADAAHLAPKLDPTLVIMDLHARDHDGAIAEVVDWLVKGGRIAEQYRDEVVDQFAARERQMTTGMFQCAFPEATTKVVAAFVVVLARSHQGVEFNALDNLPVRLFAFTLCPAGQYAKNMKTLALLERAMWSSFRDDTFLKKIDAAQTGEEVCGLILAQL